MAELEPLIRMRRHAVEERQKFLAELYRQADALEAEKQGILKKLADEQEKTKTIDMIDIIRAFDVFAKASRDKIARIEEHRRALEFRIDAAREAMREAFNELKKIEIIDERREAEAIALIEKREAAILHETAIEIYRRRVEEESQ